MFRKCLVVILMCAFLNLTIGTGQALAGGGGGCGDSKGCQRTMNIIGIGGLIVLGAVLIGSIIFQKHDSSKKTSDDIEIKSESVAIHNNEQQRADISAELTVYQW